MKTFLLSLTFALAAMFSGLALATPGNNGGGNGGCGVGQQTNGCGGNGSAGGAVTGSGNSTNANTNLQGQAQGQAIVGSGNSTNRVNTAAAANQSQTNAGNSLTGGAVSVSVEGAKGDVYIAPAQERAPVSTAYAAPLTAANGTCMGSSSAGGQGAALGLSFGTTWTDTNCDIRYDAEALRAAGLIDAARARLCQKPEIKDAMAAAGTPCQDTAAQRRTAASVTTRDGEGFAAAQPQYQDPIIRARLGLPPLK